MRFIPINVSAIFIMFFSLATAAVAQVGGVDLSAVKDWTIVIDADASVAERYAAEEFQRHFQLASGVQLPITHTAAPAAGSIRIYQVDRAHGELLNEEGFRILIDEGRISIMGGGPRGTLYGVYTFLEDYIGVRFLTHDHTHVPTLSSPHMVPFADYIFEPVLHVRWNQVTENARHPEFAARLRCNAYPAVNNPHPSRSGAPDLKLGGLTGWVLINHTFDRFVPTAEYGNAHPDYFALVGGKRLSHVETDAHDSQLCLTHPDVRRIVRDAVLNEIANQPDRENFSVSQNDNELYCRCEKCAAIDETEGSAMGSLLTFVNGIAADIARENPDIKIGTLAYQYSRKPPATIRPHPNVQIQLATIECSLMQPINDPHSELNRPFCADFEQWAERSDEVYIWTYNTNFDNYLLPVPNLRILDDNIRFFVEGGVKGIFFEDAHAPVAGFADIRNYVTSRLLWDPSQDGDALADEFVTLHYGPAAEPIRNFINAYHDHVEQQNIASNCFGTAREFGLDDRMVEAGLLAVTEALALAGDDEVILNRVRKFSIAIECAAVSDAWEWMRKNRRQLGELTMDEESIARFRPHARRLFELGREFGVTEWRPVMPIEQAESYFKQAFGLADDEAL